MDTLMLKDEIRLNNAKLYPTYDSRNSIKTITGPYYIYNNTIKNNRIRVTDSKDKVGKPCQMTGWVNITDIVERIEADEE